MKNKATKAKINLVWFKRDLRLTDHEPLLRATDSGLPLMLLYVFEPSLMADPHYDERHFRFIQQSIDAMNLKLKPLGAEIVVFKDEVEGVINKITQDFTIETVFSYQETGINKTFDRDKKLKVFFKKNQIRWQESVQNGIRRGFSNRENWQKDWYDFIQAPFQNPDFRQAYFIQVANYQSYRFETNGEAKQFQPGGEEYAIRYLESFLSSRIDNYMQHISKPEFSRKSCSRISPYLAWGNVSLRQVYHAAKLYESKKRYKFNFENFLSRLRWNAHFIQRFEDEVSMEFHNLNRTYDVLKRTKNEVYIKAWEEGQTGFPLVDACMRCLRETGYINFRMRAMLASFFCHLLWQDWRDGVHFLARQFLDFEPGIHYSQWQMQGSMTGINTIRIYNPIKQAEEQDPEGTFIKKWVPELSNCPSDKIHQPTLLTDLEQALYGIKIGVDYPMPIVDFERVYHHAKEQLFNQKKSVETKAASKKILKKHIEKPEKQNDLFSG